MTSTRPYIVRAFYEWINDNQCTAYLVINAEKAGVKVPVNHIEDGKIVLNISPIAVRDLVFTNKNVQFQARFGGIATQIYAPMSAVMAIYAQENGRGMVFNEEEYGDEDESEPPELKPVSNSGSSEAGVKGPPPTKGKPNLTVVK